MLDRIPLPVIAGSLTNFIGTDLPIGILPGGSRFRRLHAVVNEAPVGGTVVVEARTAPAGGGSGIQATIADGQLSGLGSGIVALLADTACFLRIVSADADALNLSGWLEVDEIPLSALVGDLTTLERVHRFMNLPDSNTTHDTLIGEIIAGVSDAFRQATGQGWTQQVIVDEWPDSLAQSGIVTAQGPIISIQSVTIGGVVLVAAEYEFRGRILTKLSAGELFAWPQGRRVVKVNYTAGYVLVPEDIVLACTMQVAHGYHQSSASGQGRLGMQSKGTDAGGATSYLSDDWLPFARTVIAQRKEVWPS